VATLVSLLFIAMIPNFFLHLFVIAFFKIIMIISRCAQLLIGGKVCFIFIHFQSIICSVINGDQYEKCLYNQSSYYRKYGVFNQ